MQDQVRYFLLYTYTLLLLASNLQFSNFGHSLSTFVMPTSNRTCSITCVVSNIPTTPLRYMYYKWWAWSLKLPTIMVSYMIVYVSLPCIKKQTSSRWATDSNIIGMTAGSSVFNQTNWYITAALEEAPFTGYTCEIAHPNSSNTLTKCSISERSNHCRYWYAGTQVANVNLAVELLQHTVYSTRKSRLPTRHSGIIDVPSVITDSTPLVVVANLHSSFHVTSTTSESDSTLSTSCIE